jgi:multiple sugar transport system substrate-binding protein
MQQTLPPNPSSLPHRKGRVIRRTLVLLVLASGVVLATLPGCGGDPNPRFAAKAAPFAGVALTLRCPDEPFKAALTQAARSWATRTGATVTLTTGPMTPGDDTDVGVIPAAEFGEWADRGDLVPVPASLRASDHPFQWIGVLPAYREQLVEWGGQARALPLAGEGSVIVYRADRLTEANLVAAFRKHGGEKPGAPATWEEFAALAAAFAEVDGKPSLPAMSGAEVADLFFRVAACYDRRPLDDVAIGKVGGGLGGVSFHHDVRTGEPGLGTPGFAAAADWLAGLAARKCFATDPTADLTSGKAMLAVASLAQLAKLRSETGALPARYAIAPLPGTRSVADPEKGELVRGGVNYVPYFSGGRLGVVRTRCANAEAAFDLLADLGGPTRSQELLSNPALGAGPFRSAHLEQDRLLIWLGYGLDETRSKALQAALQQNIRAEVRNAVYALRGPDQKELTAAAVAELAKVAAGTVPGDAGLKQLRAAWERIDQKTPQETRLRWRKLAAGVN